MGALEDFRAQYGGRSSGGNGGALADFQSRFTTARLDPNKSQKAGGLNRLDEKQLASFGYKPLDIADWNDAPQRKQKSLENAIMGVAKTSSPFLAPGYTFGSISKKFPSNNVVNQDLGTWGGLSQAFRGVGGDAVNNFFPAAKQLAYTFGDMGYRSTAVGAQLQAPFVKPFMSDKRRAEADKNINELYKKADAYKLKGLDPTGKVGRGDFGEFVKTLATKGTQAGFEIAPMATGVSLSSMGIKGAAVPLLKGAGLSGTSNVASSALQGNYKSMSAAERAQAIGTDFAMGAGMEVAGYGAGKLFKTLTSKSSKVTDDLVSDLVKSKSTSAISKKLSNQGLGEMSGVSQQLARAKSKGEVADILTNTANRLDRVAEDINIPKQGRSIQAPEPTKNVTSQSAADAFKTGVVSADQKQKGALATKTKEAAFKVKEELYDRYSPLQRLSKEMEKITGSKLDVASDPYSLARLHAGVGDKVMVELENLGKIYKQAPDLKTLKEIGVARRIMTDRSNIKNPISVEEATKRMDDIRAKIGDEAFKKYDDIASQVIAKNDEFLGYLADNGIIGKEALESIRSNNQNYFAKFDVVEHLLDNNQTMRGGKSFNVASQDLIKSQKGTTKAIVDPIESTVRQYAKGIDLVERNKVGQALYNISDSSDGLIVKLGKDGAVPPGYEKISTFIDGNKIDMAVPSEVGAAFKSMNSKQADMVTQWVGRPQSALLRSGATGLNVGFAITNAVRDFQTLALNSKNIPLIKILPAWMDGMKNSVLRGIPETKANKLYKDFLSSGGGQSTYFSKAPKDIKDLAETLTNSRGQNAWKTLKNPKDAFGVIPVIEKFNETIELAPRLAEFKAGIKKGKSGAEAALNARESTVDFAKSGNVMKTVNMWIPFLNARTQGTGLMFKAIKENPKRAIMYGAAVVGTPAVLTYLHNRTNFSDEYDGIASYVKDNNFIIIYGKGKDKDGNLTDVIKIPKGEAGKILANPIENFLEYAHGKDAPTIQQVALQMLSNASPVEFSREGNFSPASVLGSALPPIVKGFVENQSNYSFYKDAPLVSRKMSELPNREQTYNSTSQVAKMLGGFTGQSPVKMDNLLQATTGGAYKYATPGGAQKATVGRVTGAQGGNVESKFYSIYGQLVPEKNSVSTKMNQAISKGDDDRAIKIANEFNQSIDSKFERFNSLYGALASQDLKDRKEDLKIKTSSRAIKSRKNK